ncbi:MAG: asparagine synthase (glutamine-hydrolyzing) [Blastocatellia bacterium]
MCGIFGIITADPRADLTAPATRAVRAMAHRGPDDEGIEVVSQDPPAVFAHRRLSILDLSPAGHQPMRDEANGNRITYNGEVFNFREARERLRAGGLVFQSESDTEVLLKGYGLLGEAAIADWRGMFAFGLWQPRDRRLTLVRDRLGIKPLYYFHDGETFLFASEVRALLATGLIPRRVSQAALASFLAYGSVEQPLTIIENVFAVLPGHTLTFQDGRIERHAYWQLRADPVERDDRSIREEIAALVAESVRLRLVSDVPVGVFLSGGIDSSAVTALARRATTGAIQSFSVCFNEREFSEQAYAEQVARRYETEHHTVLVTEEEILAKLPRALRAMDQPSIDGVNSYIVSEAAAQSGLKVALSGLGGDEVFAGYGFFRTIVRDERLRARARAVPGAIRRAAASAIGAVAASNRAIKVGALLGGDHFDEHSVLLYRRLFTDEQQRRLLGAARCQSDELDHWRDRQTANCAGADPVNQASALELGGYLANTLLRDTDAMSMAHSLEVRVPLIDHKLVERMLAIHGSLKLRPREPKWLLTEAVSDLPREIIDRPKRGFELPFKHWLAGALRNEVERTLRSPVLTNFLNADAMQSVWNGFLTGRISWTRAWSFYVLGQWLEGNLSTGA